MLDIVVLFSLTFPFNLYLLFAILEATKVQDNIQMSVYVNGEELTPRPISKRGTRLPPSSNSGVTPSKCTMAMELLDRRGRSKVVEFQAVILAGYGNALVPLTNNHGENASPKCLLPIANKPMIDFPLTWLEEAGVTDVLLICPYSHRFAISHHIHSDISSSTFSSLTIDIQTYDEADDIIGTCSLLRKFASLIQHDFIILPCDFVPPPNLPLSTVLNRYRVDSEDMIVSTLFYEVSKDGDGVFTDEGITPPLVVYDADSRTLLGVDYNLQSEGDELELHMRLLWKYPKLRIATYLADSHVYVCRRSILSVILQKPALESIREDLIPFLCKVQYRKGKRARWEPVLNEISNRPSHPPLTRATSSWVSTNPSRTSSAPVSPISPHQPKARQHGLRCGIETWSLNQGMTARANTIKGYADLNRLMLKEGSPYLATSTPTMEHIDAKPQVSLGSIIGASTQIGGRTNIKQSVVGRHCVIGQQVRVLGSVIMDHAIIEDGAKIDGCIIGRSTRVGSKAELVKSITQHGYEVEAGAILKGEKLEAVDWDPHVEEE